MASNKFTFQGLDELRAKLRALPPELTGEASKIVEGEANGAAATVKAVYGQHAVTGNLRDKLVVNHTAPTGFTAKSVVRSNSPLAWLFDNGSQARHYITASGKTHATGKMWGKTPPTHIFARTMSRARRSMHEKLAAMLERHGAVVTRDAG